MSPLIRGGVQVELHVLGGDRLKVHHLAPDVLVRPVAEADALEARAVVVATAPGLGVHGARS